MAPRSQRTWHVIKGNKVNVGGPNGSPRGVLTNKYKSEEVKTTIGSQMNRSTDEASNDGGGKDSG